MLLFNRNKGVIKLEMNQKDAEDLAAVLASYDESAYRFFNLTQKMMVGNLPKLLLEKDSKNSEEDALVNPEYYVNTKNGDMMIINWGRNRPTGENWKKISEDEYLSMYSGQKGEKNAE